MKRVDEESNNAQQSTPSGAFRSKALEEAVASAHRMIDYAKWTEHLRNKQRGVK